MQFFIIAALLFPAAIMAAPPVHKPASGNDQCLPTTYILSEYILKRSPTYAFVSFNVQTTYTADSDAVDPVQGGANCEADGVVLSNHNECNIAGGTTSNLVFDLRKSSEEANYRITHQWSCNNATWVSDNDIELPPLDCDVIEDGQNGDSVTCTADPIIFTPQNAHKVSNQKVQAHKAKPTHCPKC